jgi:aminoglycoside phosphotransferase family enzyme
VTALAINYVFFALDHPAAWRDGFRPLWRRFLGGYLDATGDRELLEVAPPWLAWRALVLANPAWYPNLAAGVRDKILTLAEEALDRGGLDLDAPERLFS